MESDTTQSNETSLADVVQLLQRQDANFRAELDMIRQDMAALAARLPAGDAPEPLARTSRRTLHRPRTLR